MMHAEARKGASPLGFLDGYDLLRLIRKTRSTAVYQASRKRDGFPVIAKFYVADQGAAEGHFEHEYELLRSLAVEGAVEAVDLVRSGQQHVLILKRFPGVDLDEFTGGRPLDIETFLVIAVKITAILADVHARRVIHRDIKPSSILIEADTLDVCLADFGISVALERDHREIYDPGVLSGTLPYLAPEQTGRTTRAVDHRSDLYSLGATFYEMLAGHAPFTETEPLKLVHAHLARTPPSIKVLRPELPEVLASLVARLLAKDPVDRYQSARGLLHDLERCQQERTGFELPSFELGDSDASERLELPNRLYGRKAEVVRLSVAFGRACRGHVECVFLHGPSGIGKTALIESLQPQLADREGYFASGKFEQFRSNMPLLGVTQALSSLVARLLIEDDRRLEGWKHRLSQALEGTACVLLPLIPQLEHFVGPQPEAPELGVLESRNRLLLALGRLISTIAAPDHPLVLFLDDLQWSDPISLRVIEQLVTASDAKGLLLIGAYRSEEVGDDHPLRGLAQRVDGATDIPLGPLASEAVAELIVDALKVDADRAAELAAALAGRTDNNPLLVRQFLVLLEEDGALTRGPTCWTWSADAVRKSGIPGDAVGMIKAKIARLSAAQREVLAAAACVGSRFELVGLAAALERRPAELLPQVISLADEGLLALSDSVVCFTHDRIEEGARHWLDRDLKHLYHRRVGHFLRDNTPEDQLSDRLYEIVDHLNQAIAVEDDVERLWELAELDLQAGRAGLRASASAMAARHLEAGLEALERASASGSGSSMSQGRRDDLALALGVQHARCISLMGEYERASTLFDALMKPSLAPLDYANAAFLRLEACAIASHQEDAIRWGLAGLDKLGVSLARSPGMHSVVVSLVRMKWSFRAKARAELDQLAPCEDPEAQLRMELLTKLVGPAFVTGGNLLAVIIVRAALESLESGRTQGFCYYLILVCMLLAGGMGDFEGAAELANHALGLARDPNATRKGITVCISYCMILHWTRPYTECLAGIDSSLAVALEEGELEYATYATLHSVGYQSALGRPLDVVRVAAQESGRFADNTGMSEFARAIRVRVRMSEVLEGSKAAAALDPSSFELLTPRCIAVNWSMQPFVFLGQPQRALALSELIVKEAEEGLFALYLYPEFVFYRGMAAALAHADARVDQLRHLRRVVRKSHRKLAKWTAVSPDNLKSHTLLLAAELARIDGETETAQELYSQVTREAGEFFPHIEALAWERLGLLMIARGWEGLARTPLMRAHEGYSAWGAIAKVAQLHRDFPDLPFLQSSGAVPYNVQQTVSTTTAAMSASLDVASVLKSTLGITRGQGHDEVVSSVLAAAIENAGAQRGVLVQQIDGALYVVVENDNEGSTGRVRQPIALAEAEAIVPIALIRLVARTSDSRIIHDARAELDLDRSSTDSTGDILSVACVPIRSQNQLVGVLYLENRLVTGVFTPDRLELLEHLAAQAAISLQSARLFDALRGREAQWRSLVEHAPDNIAIVNEDGTIEFINRGVIDDEDDARAVVDVSGVLVGQRMNALFAPEYHDRVTSAICAVFESGQHASFEAEVLGEGEERRWWTTRLSPIFDGEKVLRVTLISTDDTEHRQLEGQLRQSQKMEAVGTLAGGVAHDFNNLLSVILGSAELAREGLYPTADALEDVMSAAQRATGLTRQLLAFSRKQVLQPRVLDLNESVNSMSKMLRRLIGEDIELILDLSEGLGWVRVDPGQLEQVVLNLVVNARDAMATGGMIQVRSSQSELSPAMMWRHDELEPGLYLRLEVCDSGAGMDTATRERIFDPFFTTKAAGKGTGLGLSTVHGIVKQSGGFIEVASELGEGTTFSVYLPVVDGSLDAGQNATGQSSEVPSGRETILLVEDEDAVRKLMITILSQQGYTVIEAADGEEALKIATDKDWIDMLLIDVVLPGVSSTEVTERVLEKFRDMAVLYVSGYTDDSLVRHGIDSGARAFLKKPFTREELARRVRESLDE